MTTMKKAPIEAMARAINPVAWSDVEPIDFDARKQSLWEATAAFAAIEAAELAVVPATITPEMREAVRAKWGRDESVYAKALWPDLVEFARVK